MRHQHWTVALCATGCLLAAVPAASAATIAVDDDGAQCPAAPVTSVQRAVDLAAPGDTIAVCPGDYREGRGVAGSNGVTISKPLTIRGAGADLVRIRPRALQQSGSSIAKVAPDVTSGTGSIVVARQPVQLSGVTIDGAGVVAEAGVLLIDAPGSTVRRVRVTNLVTSEAASASSLPGGYRSGNPGIGIAVLGAGAPGTTAVSLSRIDRYNTAGLLVSGAGNRATVSASQVIGRSLCQEVEATGNCDPLQPVLTGPLFGQDGVRATAGGAVEVTGSIASQNQVAGENAPVAGSATNNANLSLGAGVRVVGGAASKVARSNIVDNAYGVFNDGSPVVSATQNWWGLRYPTGPGGPGGTPAPVNTGPAISPTTNPPIPENPVNGAAVADNGAVTSDLVDFFPFRDGPQSDPVRGEWPIVDAPGLQPDAAPSLTLTAQAPTVAQAAGVPLTAEATDDFGVTGVSFYDGAARIGFDSDPPYTASYVPPVGTPCGPRTLTAVAEDSGGQSAGAATSVEVTGCSVDAGGDGGSPGPGTGTGTGGGGATPGGGSIPAAPTLALAAPNRIPAGGARVALAPSAPAGVRSVVVFVGARPLCTLTAAPYRCRFLPRGADVGRQVVRAVLTDALGRTTQATQVVRVAKFAVRRLSIGATRKSRRVTLTVRLVVPDRSRVTRACPGRTVTLVVRRAGRSVRNARVRLGRSCTGRVRLVAAPAAYTARATFAGSATLAAATTTKRFR